VTCAAHKGAEMSVAAIILNYNRAPNIPIIVQALQNGKVKPNEIIVIDNNPKNSLKIKGVTLIRCSRNFGCQIRHALGQVIGATHCLFIDDDLNIGKNTLRNFLHYHKKLPEAILGHFGVVINPKAKRPYGAGTRVSSKDLKGKPVEVDIVLGRIHFCRVDKLAQAFVVFNKTQGYPPPGSGVDDILLSMANRQYGHKNYVVPAGPLSITHNLQDFGTGLYKRKAHFGLRNLATQLLLW